MKYRIKPYAHCEKIGYAVEKYRRFLWIRYWSFAVEELGWNCSDIVFRKSYSECQDYIDHQLKLEKYG